VTGIGHRRNAQARVFLERAAAANGSVRALATDIMDDARGLNGQNGSPTVPQLKQRIEVEFPGRKVDVRYDILRITPE